MSSMFRVSLIPQKSSRMIIDASGYVIIAGNGTPFTGNVHSVMGKQQLQILYLTIEEGTNKIISSFVTKANSGFGRYNPSETCEYSGGVFSVSGTLLTSIGAEIRLEDILRFNLAISIEGVLEASGWYYVGHGGKLSSVHQTEGCHTGAFISTLSHWSHVPSEQDRKCILFLQTNYPQIYLSFLQEARSGSATSPDISSDFDLLGMGLATALKLCNTVILEILYKAAAPFSDEEVQRI
ncbi:hypothetical protein BDK51DRAFT_29366 [Blyttiomyces helicus]|uniref:Uncharacterized protein n=1 Tax=Blyttiomyces helicus TaxID=388810 RepID=A0A4P9WNF6_9FUNG|nr:hypothetical protein BDK51DRAFT_29366 [Blyttiomyces helicus]|eukprot:RKO94484.1 hypothetical protein BDK51DRAFT_29366 [Blyttiomyces helicus]